MNQSLRVGRWVTVLSLAVIGHAFAQEEKSEQADALPSPFSLDDAQQRRLDEVFVEWERSSRQVESYACSFKRREYIRAINRNNLPDRFIEGELAYRTPNQWYYRETAVRNRLANGWGGQHPGVDWYRDGDSIYEVDHLSKRFTERPIPRDQSELVGRVPLFPFWLVWSPMFSGRPPYPVLFGDSPSALRERFWFSAPEVQWIGERRIWRLSAAARFSEDESQYAKIDIMLVNLPGSDLLRPCAVRFEQLDGDKSSFELDLESAKINPSSLEFAPQLPVGYLHIREETAEDGGV